MGISGSFPAKRLFGFWSEGFWSELYCGISPILLLMGIHPQLQQHRLILDIMGNITKKSRRLKTSPKFQSLHHCFAVGSLSMSSSINIACGFMGGTIFSVEGGYRVLQHPRVDRIFDRIADARWFLAVDWCEHCSTPAGIMNHEGQLSFQNEMALAMGEIAFLPLEHRKAVFDLSLTLEPGITTVYGIPSVGDRAGHRLEILGLEIDPRYGKVAVVSVFEQETAL